MADFNSFKSAWQGRRVDFDHIYFYQCVDLIQQYVYELFGIPGAYGNAIDYWDKTDARLLPKFDKLSTRDLKEGDIVVLRGLSGNPYGHIGIATGEQTATTFKMLEQNGATGNGSGTGNDAITVFRSISKDRIAGILRPKVAAAPIPPQPAKDARIGKILYLHPVPQWSVYRVGQQPIRSQRIGYLVPQNYKSGLPAPKDRGLTYRIEGVSPYPNTVTIRTATYGLVDIYVDSDGEII